MTKLTNEQVERAQKAFNQYDTNNDGRVTVDEFTEVVEKFLTPEDTEALLEEVNPNGDDEISWEEFLQDYENDL
ncbi:MAG TPA: EF-hand domain-containing protein [Pseudomonas sp.]|uniref:EF-hand domain-containing protein n=1 Tax=Pseudomonas sp. TaxID=306 RepID=UPI002C5EBBA8|nr:EF-hand domain-containing protein [Pseudomonas sp.]HWH87223.1 EF-hand domain-containing protein [Pseudomonas sp.]